MPVVMEPSWVGRRVSVRRVLPSGTPAPGHHRGHPDSPGKPVFGDLVGELLHLDADTAILDTRHGLVELAVADVVAAKIAPPSTADELALEAVAAQGWRPAETGAVGGWVLRAASGFTGRANSVLPLKAPGLPLDDAIEAARAWYAERGLPLRFQLPVEARRLLDATLAERGWPADPDVHVMAARLDLLAGTRPSDPDVTITTRPDDAWFGLYRDGDGSSPAARALLTRHDNVGFAEVHDAGQVVAIGRGAVDRGWIGITAVEVDPTRRRQGLAGAVMRALRDWGLQRGATRGYLQVSADNAPAVTLYEGLGYWRHHDYRYRRDAEAASLG